MVLNTTNGMFDEWSVARSAGFTMPCIAGPGVPLRSTPGFTLSPAPRALLCPCLVVPDWAKPPEVYRTLYFNGTLRKFLKP